MKNPWTDDWIDVDASGRWWVIHGETTALRQNQAHRDGVAHRCDEELDIVIMDIIEPSSRKWTFIRFLDRLDIYR